MLDAVINLDLTIVRSAVDFTASHPAFGWAVFVSAEVLIFLLWLLVYVLWRRPEPLSRHHGNKKAALLVVMSVLSALAVKAIINFAIGRERPFMAHPDLEALPLAVSGTSFPSGHTLMAFAIAGSLWFSRVRPWAVWAMVAACLIALARVFAGVHYPTDIVAGAAVGLFSAWYLHREASSIKKYLPNA